MSADDRCQRYLTKGIALLLAGAALSCSTEREPVTEPGGVLRAAALAIAGGPGGCRSISNLSQLPVDFFPDVTFYKGTCSLEHGTSFSAIVAQDRNGQVFPLDSPSNFRFLRLVHPPRGLDSTSVGDYALLSLRLSGKVLASATALDQKVERVPAGLSRSTDTTETSKHTSTRLVWVTVRDKQAPDTYGILVDLGSGEPISIMDPQPADTQ